MGSPPIGKTTMYMDKKVLAELRKLKEPGEHTSHVVWRLIQEHKAARRLKA